MKVAKSILRKGNLELVQDLEKLRKALARLEKKHKISSEKLIELIKPEVLIPASIFRSEITVLEASVKYMKENLGYNFHQIGGLLNRNEKNIWHAYSKAEKKFPGKMKVKDSKYLVPTFVFKDRRLSPLEAVAFYLKTAYKLKFHEVAVLLHRNDRTIWTVVKKAEKKGAKADKRVEIDINLAKDIENYKARMLEVRKKHGLRFKQILKLLKDVLIPASIFKPRLTSFEAIVKYLKENLNMGLSEIARMLDRDQRDIWHAYDRTKKKHPRKLIVKETKYFIPASILKSKQSPLEAVAKFLREHYKFSYHEIALMLKKDDRTIWSVINK